MQEKISNWSQPTNDSGATDEESRADFDMIFFPFDRPEVRLSFIVVYSIVFSLCFFGNSAVVLVVNLHWRMKSPTKFCLGNLAFANLSVAIFCIYQNLSTYLMDTWPFGDFLCKMYYFIMSLSYTASILILVVICAERYLAILHPFLCRRLLTVSNLRIVIITVWLLSALISSPRLYYMSIMINYFHLATDDPDGAPQEEVICSPQQNLYNNALTDILSFTFLFILPLSIMSVLYFRMALHLSRVCRNSSSLDESIQDDCSSLQSFPLQRRPRPSSSPESVSSGSTSFRGSRHGVTRQALYIPSGPRTLPERHILGKNNNSRQLPWTPHKSNSGQSGGDDDVSVSSKLNSAADMVLEGPRRVAGDIAMLQRGNHRQHNVSSPDGSCHIQRRKEADGDGPKKRFRKRKFPRAARAYLGTGRANNCVQRPADSGRRRAVQSRQSVIRMLVMIVITFALCNLPFHVRKLCQNYLSTYDFRSQYAFLITPITFLFQYANCAINPILFAFMSQSFRSCFVDLVHCRHRRNNVLRRGRRALPFPREV